MKKLIFILFGLLLYLNGFTQSYKPVLDGEIIRWSFLDQRDCADYFFYVKSTEIIAYGDVLINNVIYKKLYLDYFDSNDAEESNVNWQNHTPQLYYEWENFFIRESEDATKLYIYNSYWDEEYLISDMTLQKGETFQLQTDFIKARNAIVDEVYLQDGLKHIQWHFTDYVGGWHTVEYTFIESIGSNMWFMYPDGCNRGTWGLNCFQNQKTFYKNNEIIDHWDFADSPCGYYYSYADEIHSIFEDNYYIFIEKNTIEILFDFNLNADISLYDMQGKLCYMKENVFDRNIEISTISLPKGIYVLNIFDRKKLQNSSKKIILR